MKTCPKCQAEHENNGTFCSRKCANSRTWAVADRQKKSIANKGIIPWNKGKKEIVTKTCLCGNTFTLPFKWRTKKYCSIGCSPKMGGYREGSGRGKSGYYKGIFCNSTYELCWAIYQIDHNKEFIRFPNVLYLEGRKYYPDFLQDGKIIEIKGYEKKESLERKIRTAEANGYDIIVLFKDDLKKEFAWVAQNYTKAYHTLYDKK